MTALDLARKCVEIGEVAEAQRAYVLALHQNNHEKPEIDLEAAMYILQTEGEYKISYTCFVYLYNHGFFKKDIMAIMMKAFYEPNCQELVNCLTKNINVLNKYYLFYGDLNVDTDDMNIMWFPFDDEGYIPYYKDEDKFGNYFNPNLKRIDRYFFENTDNPILAEDVYSQYHLEYLNDSVRKSEWIARDNHIYLHYADKVTFMNYCQVLDFSKILTEKKIVILLQNEKKRYPIDFKLEFGIDYSKNKIKKIQVEEINKIIWHTQLSAHNGGDFFNEVIDDHPYILLPTHSIFYDKLDEHLELIKTEFNNSKLSIPLKMKVRMGKLKVFTKKDALCYWTLLKMNKIQDDSRIVPAICIQPHFKNIYYDYNISNRGIAQIFSKEYQRLKEDSLFKNFKYIKTFTPMRRITNSYAATIHFMKTYKDNQNTVIKAKALINRVMNQSYYIDESDPLFRDSSLVRFEDGKLNPEATFRALAEFLDVPYTQSMTYCSEHGVHDVETLEGNAIGFDAKSVYKKYEEYANDAERFILEYFSREAMETYEYGFEYYQGGRMTEDDIEKVVMQCTTIFDLHYKSLIKRIKEGPLVIPKNSEGGLPFIYNSMFAEIEETKRDIIDALIKINENDLKFVNKEGQPLKLMPLLHPKEEYLVQPLYH